MKEVIILDSSSLRMSKDRSQSCVVYIINRSLRSSLRLNCSLWQQRRVVEGTLDGSSECEPTFRGSSPL